MVGSKGVKVTMTRNLRTFLKYCSYEGIGHKFSAPITPQQNGVVKCKNITLQN